MVKAVQIKPLDGLPEGTVRELDKPDFKRLKAFGAVREATEEEWANSPLGAAASMDDGLDGKTIEELGQIARDEKIEPTEDEMKAHVVAIIRRHRQRGGAEINKDVRRMSEAEQDENEQGGADLQSAAGTDESGSADAVTGESTTDTSGAKSAPAVENKAAPPVANKADGAAVATEGDVARAGRAGGRKAGA